MQCMDCYRVRMYDVDAALTRDEGASSDIAGELVAEDEPTGQVLFDAPILLRMPQVCVSSRLTMLISACSVEGLLTGQCV